jgi:8-oxo-dGTP pyrophosphatase MutT (NUDIX family)
MSEAVVEVVAGALIRDRRVWLAQRHPSPVAEWSEAWCLPGGKVEPGESLEEALRREWREEAAIDVIVGVKLCSRQYVTEGFAWPYRVHTFLVSCEGEPALTREGGQRDMWWPLDRLPEKRLPSTDAILLVLR